MADLSATHLAASPVAPSTLAGHAPTAILPDGHYGLPGAAGVQARILDALSAASLLARRGQAEGLTARFAAAGLPLPEGPKATVAGPLTLVGTGPGRWLAFAEGQSPDALLARLAAAAGGAAALADQSDANLLIALSGPKVRDALAKGVMVDLHPSAFGPGDAATTIVAHVGTTFWQADEAPTYRFAVPRSFAPAFLRWLAESAAEFGFSLSGAGRG